MLQAPISHSPYCNIIDTNQIWGEIKFFQAYCLLTPKNNRKFKVGTTLPLGEDLVAGYPKIPPYFRVLCTSATMEPTYLAP